MAVPHPAGIMRAGQAFSSIQPAPPLLPATDGLEHRNPLYANRRGAAHRKYGWRKGFSQSAIGGDFQGVEGVRRRGSRGTGLFAGDVNPAIGMVNHR